MKFKFLIMFFLISTTICTKLASQTELNSKYLTSLLYLLTSDSFDLKIRSFFPRKFKKRDRISFEISTDISFLSPWDVKDDIPDNQLHNISLFNVKPGKYKENHLFNNEINPVLKHLAYDTRSELLLRFSRPVQDHLMAEISLKSLNISPSIKFGPTLQILFFFDENNLIAYSGPVDPYLPI